MKNKIISIIISVLMLIGLTGCNYNLIDTKWQFNYAYITLPNDEIVEVKINSWTEDDNSITIQAEDGQVYSASYHNCLLTKNRWEYK